MTLRESQSLIRNAAERVDCKIAHAPAADSLYKLRNLATSPTQACVLIEGKALSIKRNGNIRVC